MRSHFCDSNFDFERILSRHLQLLHCQLQLLETSLLGCSSITRPGHLKSFNFIVTYKTSYRKEEMDERTGMGMEGRECEKSGAEVRLKEGSGCEGNSEREGFVGG